MGYALRTWIANLRGAFHERVDHFVAPSRFFKSVLVESGGSPETAYLRTMSAYDTAIERPLVAAYQQG